MVIIHLNGNSDKKSFSLLEINFFFPIIFLYVKEQELWEWEEPNSGCFYTKTFTKFLPYNSTSSHQREKRTRTNISRILKGCQSYACVNNYLVYSSTHSTSFFQHTYTQRFYSFFALTMSFSFTYNLVRLHMISDPFWLSKWKDLLHGSCFHIPPPSSPSFFLIFLSSYPLFHAQKIYMSPYGHRHYIILIIGIDCKKIH